MKIALYPQLHVTHIKNPNRLYAIPFLGILVKVVMLIPQFIEVCLVGIAVFILSIINSFNVLINGTNMKLYVDLAKGLMKFTTKIQLFVAGLSDKYPGFDLENDDPAIKLDISSTTKPNRWFAIPIFGGLARVMLLIPFLIWGQIIRAGAQLGVVVSFAPVLINGAYPETTYELFRDYSRLQLSASMFLGGLQDDYPSFDIDKNHMTAKIVLIVLGLLLGMGANSTGNKTARDIERNQMYPSTIPNYQNSDYNNYR